jgi:antitoxin HicB
MYLVILTPEDNGTLLVTCPDLPEVTTFGEEPDDALQHAADAIEEALAARIARRQDVPAPTSRSTVKLGRRKIRLPVPEPPSEPSRRMVRLPPLTKAKVELYRAMRADGISKAELARRLGWHGPQVDRLFDLNRRSTIEHLDQALRAIGKRLDVSVQDAA